jgi:hypothetical protein
MSAADLHARGVHTSSEYINKIVKSTKDFNTIQTTKLQRCIIKADEFLKEYVYENILNCSELTRIPWKFALTDKDYEEGLPHTREDVIFLSLYTLNDNIANDKNDHHLISTLIHEKVHIFQRYNLHVMEKLIQKLGYKEISYENRLKRSNPDITDKVYMNADGKVMIITYSSDMPTGINDIKSASYVMEHPYEKMAYDIGNEYTKRQFQSILKTL